MHHRDGANPLHHIERGILKFCGFEVAPSFVAADIYNLTDSQREALLADFEQWVGDHLAESAAAAGPRRANRRTPPRNARPDLVGSAMIICVLEYRIDRASGLHRNPDRITGTRGRGQYRSKR